jgi:dipeptidyl aminopeptidase/acylaminoacyl peptidase
LTACAATIVLHGANDTNVPVIEAEQVVQNLEARGVPVRYVLFPDEGHGFSRTGNRITAAVKVARWFTTYLGPGQPSDPPEQSGGSRNS